MWRCGETKKQRSKEARKQKNATIPPINYHLTTLNELDFSRRPGDVEKQRCKEARKQNG